MPVPPHWLWPVAAVVALAFAGLTARATRARTRHEATAIRFLLGAAAGVLAGAYVYLANPVPSGIASGVWVAAAFTSLWGFPFYLSRLRESERSSEQGASYRPFPPDLSAVGAAHLAALVLVGSFFAATDLALASGAMSGPISGSAATVLETLTSILCSPWFVLPVAAEMGLMLLLLRELLPSSLRVVLVLQAASLLASPTALQGGLWVVVSSVGAGILMVTLYAYVTLRFYWGPRPEPSVVAYTLRLVVVYALMAAGLLLWSLAHSSVLLGVATALLAAFFFGSVVRTERPAGRGPVPAPEMSHPVSS